MNKLFTGLMLATSLLFSFSASADRHAPRWGYFYTSTEQDVDSGDAVQFESQDTSDDIFLDSSDYTKIVIEHPGVYIVHYSVTGLDDITSPSDITSIEFALVLNEGATIVPGSRYAANEITDGAVELYGQAIVHVLDRNSTLQLVAQRDGINLVNINENSDVTASVLLFRIDPHNG